MEMWSQLLSEHTHEEQLKKDHVYMHTETYACEAFEWNGAKRNTNETERNELKGMK
jgi:hypothetical protein